MKLSRFGLAVHHILLQLSSAPHHARRHGTILVLLKIALQHFFPCHMSQSEKHSTPCSMSAIRLPRVCNSFTGHLMICVLQWQSSLARSYLSLIQNCGVTHMRAPIPANAGELCRTCQPRSDTEHDNVCNLLHVVCRPPALPFEVLPPVPLQPKSNSTTEPDKEKKKQPDPCPITFWV